MVEHCHAILINIPRIYEYKCVNICGQVIDFSSSPFPHSVCFLSLSCNVVVTKCSSKLANHGMITKLMFFDEKGQWLVSKIITRDIPLVGVTKSCTRLHSHHLDIKIPHNPTTIQKCTSIRIIS